MPSSSPQSGNQKVADSLSSPRRRCRSCRLREVTLLSILIFFVLGHDVPFHRRLVQWVALDTTTIGTTRALPPILYLHSHKSGGTSVCKKMRQFAPMAITSKNISESTKHWRGNCNVPGFGPYDDFRRHYKNETGSMTCNELAGYTTDRHGAPFRRNNFVALEVPLDEPLPCLGFRNFALMRNPITRVMSHMKVRYWSERFVVQEIIEHRQRFGLRPAAISDNSTTEDFMDAAGSLIAHLRGKFTRQWGEPTPFVFRPFACINNMVIRLLLGFGRPEFDEQEVGEKELALAKQVVDRYAAFVPMEKQDHPKVQAILQQRIPEFYHAYAESAKVARDREKHGDGHYERHPFYAAREAKSQLFYVASSEFAEFVRQENKFDLLLYQYLHQKLGLDYKQEVKDNES